MLDPEPVGMVSDPKFIVCESLTSRGLMHRYECSDFVHFRVTDLGLALYRITLE